MDKWQKYLEETRRRGSGRGLERSLKWFLDKGPQKKGGYPKKRRSKFGRKKSNNISAPPSARGGGAVGNPGPSLEEEVEEESFTMHTNLMPGLWSDDRLRDEIGETLIEIAEDFVENLEVDVELVDLRLTGSLANYNWSKYSDVDLHLVVDFAEIDEDIALVKAYFDAVRARWNAHHDIAIKGHEVEIYVENAGEEHVSSGIYSVWNNEWILKPTPKDVEIDMGLARKKSDDIETRVNLIGYQVEAGKHKSALDAIEKLKSKIRRMRHAGLSSPQKEFSAENIAFKILRRDEILAQLNDLKYAAYDSMMTIQERK
jgi:hypothetical protein